MQTAYNAKDCTVTVGNVYITGMGETMVNYEEDEERFSTVVGAQGDVVMCENNNPLATLTLTVQGTSPQKPYLINLANTGEVVPVWCTNRGAGERFGGSKARVKKVPSMEFAQELADREFEIQIFDKTAEPVE